MPLCAVTLVRSCVYWHRKRSLVQFLKNGISNIYGTKISKDPPGYADVAVERFFGDAVRRWHAAEEPEQSAAQPPSYTAALARPAQLHIPHPPSPTWLSALLPRSSAAPPSSTNSRRCASRTLAHRASACSQLWRAFHLLSSALPARRGDTPFAVLACTSDRWRSHEAARATLCCWPRQRADAPALFPRRPVPPPARVHLDR